MMQDDDLDHAIFALPLAVPPAGLRDAILCSTIYAQGAALPTFAMRDIAAIGAAIAVAVWLVVYAAFNPGFVSTVVASVASAGSLVRSLVESQTLTWLVAGAAVALVANGTGRLRLPRTTHHDKA